MKCIKNWLVHGDCHGQFNWLSYLDAYPPSETAIIILGDSGANFYLNEKDDAVKQNLQRSGYTYYMVRGNHEQRPELVPNMKKRYDEQINGHIYVEKHYDNIRYLMDGGIYTIDNHSVLVIGGAYSVDKYVRLQWSNVSPTDGEEIIIKKAHWFPQEQLTQEEKGAILDSISGKHYDFILTHTCPSSWEPTDLFISRVDQSTVDKSMERFLEEVKNSCYWNIWLFGHFHDDRVERPHVEQFYKATRSLDEIWNRWFDKETFKDEYWTRKGPNFYKGDCSWTV